jgi:hypothetical protein
MRKSYLIVLLFNLTVLFTACQKKVMGNDFNDFPNGRYTGVFTFDTDSTAPISYTKTYVGTKKEVLTASKKKVVFQFNFVPVSELDSSLFSLGISITDNQAHVQSKLVGYIPYNVTIQDNTIFGVQYDSSDTTYYNTLTLTYTP